MQALNAIKVGSALGEGAAGKPVSKPGERAERPDLRTRDRRIGGSMGIEEGERLCRAGSAACPTSVAVLPIPLLEARVDPVRACKPLTRSRSAEFRDRRSGTALPESRHRSPGSVLNAPISWRAIAASAARWGSRRGSGFAGRQCLPARHQSPRPRSRRVSGLDLKLSKSGV